MGKVIVFGSINLDTVVTCKRAPHIGETVHGDTLSFHPGGKGANQAVAAARCGAHTIFIGCVGADDAGTKLISNLDNNGINTSHVRTLTTTTTGSAHITVDETGDNSIVVISGANSGFDTEDIDALSRAGESDDILVCQLEIPRESTARALEVAYNNGVHTLLNAAPADNVRDLLPFTSYLVVNESEVRANIADDSLGLEDGVKALAQEFDLTVIVTLGSRGGFVASPKESFEFSSHNVNAIDTTGAGDTFVGACAAALASGSNLRESIALAAGAGALSVTKPGAQGGMPTRREVEAFLASRADSTPRN
ncbi:ribokinase [Arcanobacterium haemolyticum]|nr:ribokinase [Arcanobacterium haemolyticum]